LAEQSDGVRALRESSGERRRESRRAGRAWRRADGFGDFRVPVAFCFLVQTSVREGAGNNGVFGALDKIIGVYNPNRRSDGYIAIADR
jgi:hypothetical protein